MYRDNRLQGWYCMKNVGTDFHLHHPNPLTPVPPVTSREEPWPLFHSWRHHLWPKWASSMLNFCRSKRSFQWYAGQSDRLNKAWNVHENAQKIECKTQPKFPATTRGHSMVQTDCPSRWCSLGIFWTGSKPSRRSIASAKRKEKEKKERRKI